jgi:hypothetical protein
MCSGNDCVGNACRDTYSGAMTTSLHSAAVESVGPQIEKFATTSGRLLGWFGVAVGAAMVIIDPLTSAEPNRVVIVLGIAFGCLSWVSLVRPQASAHQRGLLMRNMARDIAVPWRRIERCAVNQTLQVVTEHRTYHGLGVVRSARSIMREQYGRTSILTGLGSKLMERTPGPSGPSVSRQEAQGGTYTSYVESRIADLATRGDHDDPAEPMVAWAPVPVALLLIAAVCIVLAFV